MRHQVTVPIAAPASAAWQILADLEQWPTWTASMTTVEPIGGGTLAPGLQVKVKQPKLREVVMTVTAVDPGRSFTWVSRSPGITTTAVHDIADTGPAASEVTLTFEMVGPLGSVTGVLFGGLIRRYVQMEADGLAAAAGSPD
jgi:uncharacterized membrane protein